MPNPDSGENFIGANGAHNQGEASPANMNRLPALKPPSEQTADFSNGHDTSSALPSVVNRQKTDYGTPKRENRTRILPAASTAMDFRKASIREVLEYYLRTDDQDAFKEFRRRGRPTIRGRCASMLRRCGDDLLDDLEQNVFLKLLNNNCRRLREFEWSDDDSIFRFIRVVATTVTIDYIRSIDGEIFLDPEDLDTISHKSFIGHQTAEIEILRYEIDKCLRSFASDRDRTIFWLFYRWGYTARQIAMTPTINLNVRKVENILQGLVRRVKNRLRKLGKNGSPDQKV